VPAPDIKLKGVGVANLAEYIRAHHGDAGMESILKDLSPEAAKMMRLPLASVWYPVRHVVEVELRTVKLFYQGDHTQACRFGAYSLRKSVNSVYRVILRVFDTTFLLQKSGALWGSFFDGGRLELVRHGDKHATAYVRDFNPIHEIYCHDLRGGFQESLVTCGGRDAKVVHTECVLKGAPACAYDARW
jgi:hypothetical protein